MAYRFVDPAPFLPAWGQRVMVPGRPTMRSVVTGRLHHVNKDIAIAFIHPLPHAQMNFNDIRGTLTEFLNVQMGMPFQSIQPCPFGQAYVTFSRVSHRDAMINNGPHQFGNTHISFIAHDKAWNNKTAIYTHAVWLMMIGLNIDIWSYALVEKAVSQFGKLMVWEEDHDNMARALVKVRVTGLDDIPWFLNFSEGETPDSDSWTVQCEIISANMLGDQPQNEDFPPNDPDDFDPNRFEFFGFGQPGQGPYPSPDGPSAQFLADPGNQVWAPWSQQNTGQQMETQGQG